MKARTSKALERTFLAYKKERKSKDYSSSNDKLNFHAFMML